MNIIIVAAKQNKKIIPSIPITLYSLGGKPILSHVIDTAISLNPKRLIIIVNNKEKEIFKNINIKNINIIVQKKYFSSIEESSIKDSIPFIDITMPTLILNGNIPLIKLNTLKNLIENTGNNGYGVITIKANSKIKCWNVVCNNNNRIINIIEKKENLEYIKSNYIEINTGIIFISIKSLNNLIKLFFNKKNIKNFYLINIIKFAIKSGDKISSLKAKNKWECICVNNLEDLAKLERIYQYNIALSLLFKGVNIIDPYRIDIRGILYHGNNVSIDVNCIFEGKVTLDNNVSIGANCIIKNSNIGSNTKIKSFTYIDGAQIENQVIIGPYSRIRSNTKISNKSKIGNFVEIKNSIIGTSSKANHLSYIGDANIGKLVNIGAGTITCNYDGINKNQTIIKDNVFVGSGVQFIAPIVIGRNSTIAAGTTVWKNVKNRSLILNKKTQVIKKNHKQPLKDKINKKIII